MERRRNMASRKKADEEHLVVGRIQRELEKLSWQGRMRVTRYLHDKMLEMERLLAGATKTPEGKQGDLFGE